MSTVDNPFLSPSLDANSPAEIAEVRGVPQSVGKRTRFANFFIDNIVVNVLCLGIGIVMGIMLVASGAQLGPDGSFDISPGMELVLNLIGIPIALGYYLGMEAMFGRTLGKMVTGTRVVDANGNQPPFLHLLGRTFARLIPFEPFSFFGKEPRGWHDTLSKTYVVSTRNR